MKTIIDKLLSNKEEKAKGIFFLGPDNEKSFLSYSSLYQNALKSLHVFQKKGMKKGDCLIFQLDNNESFLTSLWACMIGGILPIPLPISPDNSKLINIIKVIGQPFILTGADKKSKIEQSFVDFNQTSLVNCERILIVEEIKTNTHYTAEPALEKINENDIAFIQFSSGSTGNPKGVMISHANLFNNVRDFTDRFHGTEQDVHLSWLPLTHNSGLIAFHFNPLFLNSNQYILPTSLFLTNPQVWLEKAHLYKATIIGSPNFGYKHYLNHFKQQSLEEMNLSSVRIIFNGAEPVSADLAKLFLHKLKTNGLDSKAMYPVYGLAEATLDVTAPLLSHTFSTLKINRDSIKIGHPVIPQELSNDSNFIEFVSLGQCLEHCALKICDNTGADLGEHHVGKIYFKGKNVAVGYYKDQAATASYFGSEWIDTGDVGFLVNQELYITGRAKDIIFVNGQNYFPNDLEAVATGYDLSYAGRIVACGVPDPKTKKDAIVFFILKTETDNDLYAFCYKLKVYMAKKTGLLIQHIIPIDAIPKTSSGKVMRYQLVNNYLEGSYTSVIQEIEHAIENDSSLTEEVMETPTAVTTDKNSDLISAWLEDWLSKSGIVAEKKLRDMSFLEMGLDSVSAVKLSFELGKFLGVSLKPTILWDYPTVTSLSIYISNKYSNKNSVVEKAESKSNSTALDALSENDIAKLLMAEINKSGK